MGSYVIIISILQMKKLSYKMVIQLAQDYVASKWQGQDVKAGNIALESTTQYYHTGGNTIVKFQNPLQMALADFLKPGICTILIVHAEPST